MGISVVGSQPRKPEPLDDEIEVKCWKCGHRWNAPFSWNLVFYGHINCPSCKTVNEIGD